MNAPHAMRHKRLFVTLAASALLGACALPLPTPPAQPVTWDLGLGDMPAEPGSTAKAGSRSAIGLAALSAPDAIDTSAITYRLLYADGAQQPRPYARARWTMPPAQLMTERLRHALGQSHPVLEAGSGLAAIELRGELDTFTQTFANPESSESKIGLRMTAIAPAAQGHRLLGQRRFTASVAAPSTDAAGGAQAMRTAADQIIGQITQWVQALSEGGQPASKTSQPD